MFDWARGSQLKRFIERRLFRSSWHGLLNSWLKNWSTAWVEACVEFRPDMKFLDVGCCRPVTARYLNRTYGSEAHVLDVDESYVNHFGMSREERKEFEQVNQHYGLAGEEILPAEHFDFIMSVSAIEHTYDQRSPMDPQTPLAHINALRDMVRMLKPGGLMMMNWDVFLTGVDHFIGWDVEADFALLQHCGLRLACPRRAVRNSRYIFNHPDTLFFSPEAVLQFPTKTMARGTSINMLWRKPGPRDLVTVRPRKQVEDTFYPAAELAVERQDDAVSLTSNEIDQRFQRFMGKIEKTLGDKSKLAGHSGQRVAA